ncbi:hypothetical protein [Methanococcoides sp. FTZ1]|uniref:hypothetical protein n=1 Tax=Methanococcoides sp. FTZ1 TaxID=3439061 RepID=UPI003F8491D4
MDPLTVAGIAIVAFVLVVAVTAMNLKAASSFKKESSVSSTSSPDKACVKKDNGDNEDEVEGEDGNKDGN